MPRERLPNRRENETVEVVHEGAVYAVTLGFKPATGEVREIFSNGAKVGSAMDGILDDGCILMSILLQNGVSASSFAGSMGHHGLTNEPSSIIGRLVRLLGEHEKDGQPPIPSSPDPLVAPDAPTSPLAPA